jgi:hypothetical protein
VQQLDDDADTREEVDQGARTGVKILATPAVRSAVPKPHTRGSVADPDPGSGAFLTPGSGIRDG